MYNLCYSYIKEGNRHMKRYFYLFALVLLIQNALFAGTFTLHKTLLQSVFQNTGTISDTSEIQIGSTGVIYHSFNHENGTIIAQATVIAKDGKTATLRFTPYATMKQKALPSASIAPQANDQVLLNFHYDRILTIVPNGEAFNVIRKNTQLTIIHPDLFRAFLITKGTNIPVQKHFQEFCSLNAIGLVYLYLDNEARLVDCQNFITQEVYKVPAVHETFVPFYSRLDALSNWGMFKGKVRDYYSHYRSLLK